MWLAVRADKSVQDLDEELQLLIDRYTEYMHVHRMKFEHGTVELFLTITADILANLTKLNLVGARKALLTMREHRIGLLEAEMNAPGREIAYIVQARQELGGGA